MDYVADLEKLRNNYERPVIGINDQVTPREAARYLWASKNIIGTKVLDIGCASGFGVRFFSNIPNLDYKGIDYDPSIIEFAKKNYGENLFEVGDITSYNYEYYDTIIAFEVLEHIENGKEVAQELKKHCKCLLATIP